MQVRLDKLYDDIEEIETSIEAVETRLYNIRQEKTFMKIFLVAVNIYEEEQADGRILRSLKFRFLVFFNGKEI